MKRPSLAAPSTIGRAAAELVIIVAGVLIALAAQSWWEGRQVDEDRDEALGLLYDDLARLEASLRDSVGAVAVDSSIHRLVGGRPPAGDSALSAAVMDALWSFGFQIGARDGENLLPAYSDLKSSGRLGLLPDTVRARMPGVELQLVVLSRFLDDLVHFQQIRVDPILIDRFRISQEGMAPDGTVRLEDAERHAEIFAEPAARNRILLKSSLLRGQMRILREAADSVAVVRNLIRVVRPDLCLDPEDPGCRS